MWVGIFIQRFSFYLNCIQQCLYPCLDNKEGPFPLPSREKQRKELDTIIIIIAIYTYIERNEMTNKPLCWSNKNRAEEGELR